MQMVKTVIRSSAVQNEADTDSTISHPCQQRGAAPNRYLGRGNVCLTVIRRSLIMCDHIPLDLLCRYIRG